MLQVFEHENQLTKMIETHFVIWDLLTNIIIIMSVSWPQLAISTSVSCRRTCLGSPCESFRFVSWQSCWEEKYSCNEICMLYSAEKYVTTAELLSMICLLWKMHVLLRTPQNQASARLEGNQSRNPGGGIIHLHWDVFGFQRLPWHWIKWKNPFLRREPPPSWSCYKSLHWSRRRWNKSVITTDSQEIKTSESGIHLKYDWWMQF